MPISFILGENGTGKDVIARLLYRCSPRYGKPFVTIDLGSIPEQLLKANCSDLRKELSPTQKIKKPDEWKLPLTELLFLDEIGNLFTSYAIEVIDSY